MQSTVSRAKRSYRGREGEAAIILTDHELYRFIISDSTRYFWFPSFFFLFYNIFFLVLFLFSNFVCVPRNFYDHELYILLFYFLFFVFLSSFFICAFLFFNFLPLWIILLRISYFNYPIFLAFFSLLIFFNLLLFQVLLLRINLTWWFCFSIYIYIFLFYLHFISLFLSFWIKMNV